MDPAGGIIPASLDHLGYGTGCAADADQRQTGVLQPRVLFHTCCDKEIDIGIHRGQHHIADMEYICSVYGPQGDGNGLHQFPVPEQDQLCGTATQVKDNAVLHGQGIDDAQIAELRFYIPGNDMQPDSGLGKDFFS